MNTPLPQPPLPRNRARVFVSSDAAELTDVGLRAQNADPDLQLHLARTTSELRVPSGADVYTSALSAPVHHELQAKLHRRELRTLTSSFFLPLQEQEQSEPPLVFITSRRSHAEQLRALARHTHASCNVLLATGADTLGTLPVRAQVYASALDQTLLHDLQSRHQRGEITLVCTDKAAALS